MIQRPQAFLISFASQLRMTVALPRLAANSYRRAKALRVLSPASKVLERAGLFAP